MVLKMRICQTKNQLKNYANQLLGNSRKKKVHLPFIDNIRGTGLVDMQIISKCNWDLNVHYVLLAFIADMQGLFL